MKKFFSLVFICLLTFELIAFMQTDEPGIFVRRDGNGSIIGLKFSTAIQPDISKEFLLKIVPEYYQFLSDSDYMPLEKGQMPTLWNYYNSSADSAFPLNALHELDSLEELDLTGLKSVSFDSTVLPKLRKLSARYAMISGLENLNLPSLSYLSMTELGYFYQDKSPDKKSLLSKNLPSLKRLILSGADKVFDYQSISNSQIEELSISGYQGKEIGFLKNLPLRQLAINGENLDNEAMLVLANFQLEGLALSASQVTNLDFLKKQKLQSLSLRISSMNNFHFDFLKDMPLIKLDLSLSPDNNPGDISIIGKMPLKELILRGININNTDFIGQMNLENLLIDNCVINDLGLIDNINKNTRLKQLYLGFINYRSDKLITPLLPVDKLKNNSLTALYYLGNNLEFCHNLPKLEFLKVYVDSPVKSLNVKSLRTLPLKLVIIFSATDYSSEFNAAGITEPRIIMKLFSKRRVDMRGNIPQRPIIFGPVN